MNLFGRPRLGRPPKNAPKVASELSKRSPGKQQKSPGIKKDRNERDENGIPIKLKALVPPGFEMVKVFLEPDGSIRMFRVTVYRS